MQQLISTYFITAFEDDEVKRAYSRILQNVLIYTDVLHGDISAFELHGRSGIILASELLESARYSQNMGSVKVKVSAVALAHGYQSTVT